MTEQAPPPRFVALAAVDDSHAGHVVVRVAANFARGIPGAELHLVHVIEDMPPPAAASRPSGDIRKDPLGKARQLLLDLGQEARQGFDGRIVTLVAAGSPSKQTLQVAIDLQADVLVVGTHGRTGIKRMLVGSVAEAIVRKASCPVIVVREKDYHGFVPPEIEPACPECLKTQHETNGARLWCARHSEHHPRGHTYSELPRGYGGGSQLIMPDP